MHSLNLKHFLSIRFYFVYNILKYCKTNLKKVIKEELIDNFLHKFVKIYNHKTQQKYVEHDTVVTREFVS